MLLIPSVHAAQGEGVNILDFPQKLSDALNIPLFAAEILISVILLFAFLLPCGLCENPLPALIVGIGIMAFLIAIEWFPTWLLLVECLMIAFLYMAKIMDLFGGKKK